MVLKDGKSSSSDIDLFLSLILFENSKNNTIDVTFDFLSSAYDMFNFFIHLLIKSLIVLSGKETLDVDNIPIEIINIVKERFQYTGIQIIIEIKEKLPMVGPRVYIKVNGVESKLESYSLMVNSAVHTYAISFCLDYRMTTRCHHT
jgi:hypothetical protein